jgi:hypothetical protein
LASSSIDAVVVPADIHKLHIPAAFLVDYDRARLDHDSVEQLANNQTNQNFTPQREIRCS